MSVLSHLQVHSDRGLQQFLNRVAQIASNRKVRPVITPSGKRARGHFPSIKSAGRVRYESLLEQDVLRVLEVCATVRRLSTHPVVLALPGEKVVHYTPDVQIEWETGGALVETKASYFITKAESRRRLQEVVKRLAKQGLRLVLIIEQDVSRTGFQDELKELLRIRPRVGRYRPSIDAAAWDPLSPSAVDPDLERRWRSAQQECDQLLLRVMRRDPDDLISAMR